MNPRRLLGIVALAACAAGLAACATPVDQGVLTAPESQLRLRSIQSRVFDTGDRQKVLRGVVATLQDLEFMIEAADPGLGVVTARKFAIRAGSALPNDLMLTVTVYPRGERQTVVRANAEYNRKAIEEPAVYQSFFNSLGRSLFLAGREVD